MNNLIAPICLFVYNRPWHTKQTVEALLKNDLASETDLIIFSDGAKTNKDMLIVDEVRAFINTIKGFKSISINNSNSNKGLAKSIILGVTKVISEYGKIIVLEDDIVTSPYFLRYMNEGLNIYENNEDIASIHGYVYPIADLPETFFLRGADCWGWATWTQSWSIFEPNGTEILKKVKEQKLETEIDFNNSTKYIKMLKDQIKGKNDSWAIRWHLSAFLNNKLALYPGKSFVNNIGNDYSGQHSRATNIFDSIMCESYTGLKKIQAVENLDAKTKFEDYFIKSRTSFFMKVFNHLLNKLRIK